MERDKKSEGGCCDGGGREVRRSGSELEHEDFGGRRLQHEGERSYDEILDGPDTVPGRDAKTGLLDVPPILCKDEWLEKCCVAYYFNAFGAINGTEKTENKVIGMLLRHIRFLQEELGNV